MRVVVDANLLVAQVLPLDYSAPARARLEGWVRTGVDLFAPSLWSYEFISALRKYVAQGQLTSGEAQEICTRLPLLAIQDVPPSPDLHQRALLWAERLGQFVAYDGAYLAAAEHLAAEFWTADRKLIEGLRGLKVDWAHHISQAD